jgi:hypothetical protein
VFIGAAAGNFIRSCADGEKSRGLQEENGASPDLFLHAKGESHSPMVGRRAPATGLPSTMPAQFDSQIERQASGATSSGTGKQEADLHGPIDRAPVNRRHCLVAFRGTTVQ